jgi:hypothetical protein
VDPEKLFANPGVDPRELELRSDLDAEYRKIAEDIVASRIKNLWTFKYGTDGGIGSFYRRYQNIPLAEEEQRFKEAYFIGGVVDDVEHKACFNPMRVLGHREPQWIAETALDPASGSISGAAKRSAIITLAGDPGEWSTGQRRIYLVDSEYGKLPQVHADPERDTQCSLVVRHCSRYDAEGVIESNAAQRGLLNMVLVQAKGMGKVVSVQGFHTGSNKLDPMIGVEGLVPWFENASFDLPYGDAVSERKMNELANEFKFLNVYPYTDQVMAFWMCWFKLQKRLEAYVSAHNRRLRNIPAYRNRLHDFKFPKHFTQEQREDYLQKIMGREEAQAYLEDKRGAA